MSVDFEMSFWCLQFFLKSNCFPSFLNELTFKNSFDKKNLPPTRKIRSLCLNCSGKFPLTSMLDPSNHASVCFSSNFLIESRVICIRNRFFKNKAMRIENKESIALIKKKKNYFTLRVMYTDLNVHNGIKTNTCLIIAPGNRDRFLVSCFLFSL